jgi:nucleotide-binding universal stress UspA family protein
MIRNILVATDGSKVAGSAVKFAADLAKQLKAGITVLGVVDITPLMAPAMVSPPMTNSRRVMETRDALRLATGRQVDAAAAFCAKMGLKARKSVRSGRPSDEIVKEARKSKADLIVLGSHGRTAFKAMVLGSVAYGVVHGSATIPVLTVRK